MRPALVFRIHRQVGRILIGCLCRRKAAAIRDWSRFTGDYFLIPKIRMIHILSARETVLRRVF